MRTAFATVYYGDVGEKLPMHNHGPGMMHGHAVLQGRTAVTFMDGFRVFFNQGQKTDVLSVPHEIEILEDNTIYLHISNSYDAPAQVAKAGGVMMDDGAVHENPA